MVSSLRNIKHQIYQQKSYFDFKFEEGYNFPCAGGDLNRITAKESKNCEKKIAYYNQTEKIRNQTENN